MLNKLIPQEFDLIPYEAMCRTLYESPAVNCQVYPLKLQRHADGG
jgi:hypothetical protein